jgi:ribokinase
MSNLLVVGSLNMDLVAIAPRLPAPGETVLGTRFLEEFGGKGANQAYAAAKLGSEVAMLGRVGSDAYGGSMLENLRAVGCDVTGVRSVAGASGVAIITVGDSGQNSIVVVPGTNHQYTAGDLKRDEHRFAGCQWCLVQLEIPLDTVVAAARASKLHGAGVILDPAPAPQSLPAELRQAVDILTPNEAEATRMIGQFSPELTPEEAGDVASQLRALGAGTVIIKLGAKGCLLADDRTKTWVPTPSVTAIDTTAAGDVFNAALAVALSEGATTSDACRFAVSAAAISVTRLGAQRSSPSRAEVLKKQSDLAQA